MKIGNLEVYGIIYKIENLVNGKVYIGQTTLPRGFKDRYYSARENPIEKVYYTYLPKTNKEKKSMYNKHLLYSIEKYGFDAFYISEIFDIAFSKEELDVKEECWISIYNSINNGYNNRHGGSNGKLSQESKDKISKAWKEKYKNGYISPNIGNVHTEEWKQSMSLVHTGENNAMYGISPQERMDLETYDKWRNNISKSVSRGKNPFANKVVCLETRKIYDCVKDAEEDNDVTGISAVCRKIRNHCKNLHFVYYDEFIKLNDYDISNIINKKLEKKYKRVICLTDNKEFNSAMEAGEYYNIDINQIRKNCLGLIKSTNKKKFKYIEE